MTEIKKTLCHFCGVGFCPLLATVENGKVISVRMNPDGPTSRVKCLRGFLDNDGRAAIEYHYHPDRLNFPLKREGPRGSGRWQRISWDEALDQITIKLKEIREKYGPEALLVGTGTSHHTDNVWAPYRFCNPFGTPNKIGHEEVCYGGTVSASFMTFGWHVAIHLTPGKHLKCLVLPAYNKSESLPMTWTNLVLSARSGGAKLIVIDPRLTESARIADVWLQVRPGTDIAWFMAWLKIIVDGEHYDREFVEKWTNAPFLVMETPETPRILRESHLVKEGSSERFVAWNTLTQKTVVWNPETFSYEDANVKPALTGEYDVKLSDGEKVKCKTVWQMVIDRVKIATPEWAEKITWIPKYKIEQSARLFATSKPSLMTYGGHTFNSFTPGAIEVERLNYILTAITGNINTGVMVSGPIDVNKYVNDYEMELRTDEFMPLEQQKKQLGADRFKILTFPGYKLIGKHLKKKWGVVGPACWLCQPEPPTVWRAILTNDPYPVKAAIFCGSNPLLKYGNARLVYNALKKLDLIVNLEFFKTPTSEISDYLFPMADQFERPEFNIGQGGILQFVLTGERALQPEYERRTDYDFFRELGIRLGQEKYWTWKTLEEVYNYRLKLASGYKSFKEFVEKMTFDFIPPIEKRHETIDKGFATPTGRVEIYSVIMEELGYEPLFKYEEPFISPYSKPMLAKEYPLILMTCMRHLPFYHSEYYMLPTLRRIHPDPLVEIHPHTAQSLEPPIANNDWVCIETPRGRIKQRAKLTWGIHPRVICTEHCWWFPEDRGAEPSLHGAWRSNVNLLTEDDPDLCDPALGSWPIVSLLCRIYKDVS